MTTMIIHNTPKVLEKYLLDIISEDLGKTLNKIEDLTQKADIHLIKKDQSDSIGIDEIKALQKEMIYKPFQDKTQYAIVFHAQNMTHQAQNAFLKTLEEQGDDTHYILLVNNEKNLLDTISSRSRKIYCEGTVEITESSSVEGSFDIKDFMTLELHQKFKLIEKLIEEDKEDKTSVTNFLEVLTNEYRAEMKAALRENNPQDSQTSKNRLEAISLAKARIKQNTNKRLTLENLILTID